VTFEVGIVASGFNENLMFNFSQFNYLKNSISSLTFEAFNSKILLVSLKSFSLAGKYMNQSNSFLSADSH
jgi:hypothetical protein